MPTAYTTLRVLIVDADKFSRDLVKEVLETLGFESQNVLRSADGVEALDQLRATKVDIVICGRNAGTIDGVDFVRELRDPNRSPVPGVPVIFCDDRLDRQLIDAIRAVGVNEAIVKPITLGAIQSRVRSILEKPRELVRVKDYVGPERRRIDDGNVPRERRAEKRNGAPKSTHDV